MAVLVRLEDKHDEGFENGRFLEAGFGPCAETHPEPFESLDRAERRILGQGSRARCGSFPPAS